MEQFYRFTASVAKSYHLSRINYGGRLLGKSWKTINGSESTCFPIYNRRP
jgi:hypothetical protein